MKPTCRRRGGEDDRLSGLPDEIIHGILARLRSPSEAAKATVLSRRWTHLWLSYPILELELNDRGDHHDPQTLKPFLERFAAAAAKKLPHLRLEAVRIDIQTTRMHWYGLGDVVSDFITAVLNLAANRAPVAEIDINCFGSYRVFPPQLINHCRHLKVLKLQCCEFMEFDSISTHHHRRLDMVNLRVLCLSYCTYPDDRFINGLIAGAPLLEALTLRDYAGRKRIGRLQVCNHPNLKSIDLDRFCVTELIQITGVHSLETLRLENSIHCLDLDTSPFPILKSLHFGSAHELATEVFNNLIAGCPSLESLFLDWIPQVNEIKIVSLNLQKLNLNNWSWKEDFKGVIQIIDAPKLVHFCYGARMVEPPPTIRTVSNLEVAAAADFLYNVWKLGGYGVPITNKLFVDLNRFLHMLTGRFRSVRLHFHGFDTFPNRGFFDWDQVEDDCDCSRRRAVVLKHVEFKWGFVGLNENNIGIFLDGLFWSCHPEYLGVQQPYPLQERFSSIEYICNLFLERYSSNNCHKVGCKCWRKSIERCEDCKGNNTLIKKKKKG